jgi:hypothetical protein
MRDIDHRAPQRKTSSQPTPDTLLWTAEHNINGGECLRAELRRKRTRVVLDLRRWFNTENGVSQSTKKGFAISVRHLPQIKALIDTALDHAHSVGLLGDEAGHER